jgi:hypothetical protein
MSAEKPTEREQAKLARAAQELARLKEVIAPFIKEKEPIEVVTRGKWRDGALSVSVEHDCVD